jgi:hypothetical protein
MKTVYKSNHVGGTYDYLLLIVQFVRLNVKGKGKVTPKQALRGPGG